MVNSMGLNSMAKKIPVAILGASGYTGAELVRLLYNHPHAETISLAVGSFSSISRTRAAVEFRTK